MTTRRDLCLSLPALALLTETFAGAQTAAPAAAPQEAKPDPAKIAKGTAVFAHNQVFRADKLPIKTGATGSSQAVNQGVLPTGEGVEMHNTVLLPGHEPHPPHRHEHSEWLLIREGNVDWLIGEGEGGQRQPAGPGDILYAASMQLHGIRNVGTVPAKYFVMAVGPNLKG
jgi:mannose-6-phosphate isomerase-like protein (cupin superfamily)